jgi:hypothetical protein
MQFAAVDAASIWFRFAFDHDVLVGCCCSGSTDLVGVSSAQAPQYTMRRADNHLDILKGANRILFGALGRSVHSVACIIIHLVLNDLDHYAWCVVGQIDFPSQCIARSPPVSEQS